MRGLKIARWAWGFWRRVWLCWCGSWYLRLVHRPCALHCPGRWTCPLPWSLLAVVWLGLAVCCWCVGSLSSRCWSWGRYSLPQLQHSLASLVRLVVCGRGCWYRPSRSSSCLTNVHWMLVFWPSVDCRIIQSTTSGNIVGDNMQPWRTPVCTWKGSVRFPSCKTWQVAS